MGCSRTAWLATRDNPDSSGRIFFGKDAVLLGTPTPMIINPESAPDHNLYFVNLVDISVDHTRLNIMPERFLPRSNGEGGIYLDTGTTLTYLFEDVYNELLWKVDEKVILPERFQYGNNLCYRGGKEDLEDGKSVPMVTFHFEGDLNIDLQPWNTFHDWYEEYVCLAIQPTSHRSIIGVWAQQDMHVGYHTKEKMIYISPANCALL
ncbi:hypothetical protein QJS04_geneDACA002140 [Acorus gramineus]|uniref:Peptidase A1 domain-containing protein n=1 Tax=Acorus gramineus TaxID=55184 RepID=A0AAV9A876_ACOGR|nr:hypothetical protein QJS04_geneDACA002140 [Acorus gramineus]